MRSNLIIQVPFKDQAIELKRRLVEKIPYLSSSINVVSGTLSNTYGLLIDFSLWLSYSEILEVLFPKYYNCVVKDDVNSGRYLECWVNNDKKTIEILEVPYSELFKKDIYSVGDLYLDTYKQKIYNENKVILGSVYSISHLLSNKEGLIYINSKTITGLEKLYRRGFIMFSKKDIQELKLLYKEYYGKKI